jgi:hypothetical protein
MCQYVGLTLFFLFNILAWPIGATRPLTGFWNFRISGKVADAIEEKHQVVFHWN